ncbi:hypothetical protein LSH36_214g05029 [Paralvinella palmiformis]|uniref:Apple domain-containing protein n=1 Tax=Paralvinella palmiformis TaxID=53620 RepID=A0AAD9JNQ2_9ANNE|nr:hypothetical protein LSH36_214g05029 [Paralvinella palmiformis]
MVGLILIITVPRAGCQIRWDNLTDTSSVGASLQSGITDNKICLDGCVSNPNCVAVDFNWQSNLGQCWYHFDSNKILTKRSDKGITQYVLNRCYMRCQIRWNNLTSTGSAGAMLQSGLTFLDDCLKGCIFDTSCVAVDFNFKAIPKQCWFHTEMNKVQANRRDVQTNQYILDRCYKSPCPKFTPYINKHAIGGLQQNDANSKDQCEQKCLASSDCQGYDFDTQIAGCFIFNMVTREENLLTQISTNHYELVCRSGETVPPSALPTTTKAGKYPNLFIHWTNKIK